MPIKLQMVPHEKAIPTRLFGVQRQRNEVVRIPILAKVLHL
jgi:hypothetical protein